MKKSKFLKKSLAMLLAVMLVVAMIPLSAAAAPTVPPLTYITVDGKSVQAEGTAFSATYGEGEDDVIVTAPTMPKDVEVVAWHSNGVTFDTISSASAESATLEFENYQVADNGTVTIAIQVIPDEDTYGDVDPVDYTLTLTPEVLSEDIGVKSVEVTDEGRAAGILAVAIDGKTINVTAAYDTDFSGVTGGISVTPVEKASVNGEDAGKAVAVDVPAENGSTNVVISSQVSLTENWTVKTTLVPALTALSVAGVDGVFSDSIDPKNGKNDTITVTLSEDDIKDENGDKMTDLAVAFSVLANTTVTIDSEINSGDEVEIDLTSTNEVEKDVVVANGTASYTYKLKVVIPESADNSLLAAYVGGIEGKIDGTNIAVTLDKNAADKQEIVLHVAKGATISGLTVGAVDDDNEDFDAYTTTDDVDVSSPVVFSVVAEDGSSKQYRLTATKATEQSTATMTTFSLRDADGNDYTATVNNSNHTITTEPIPYMTKNLSDWTMFATPSEGARATLKGNIAIRNNVTKFGTLTGADWTDGKDKTITDAIKVISQGNPEVYTEYDLVIKFENASSNKTLTGLEFTAQENPDNDKLAVRAMNDANTYGAKIADQKATFEVAYSHRTAGDFNYYVSEVTTGGGVAYLYDDSTNAITEIPVLDPDNDDSLATALENGQKIIVLPELIAKAATGTLTDAQEKTGTIYTVEVKNVAASKANTLSAISVNDETFSIRGGKITGTIPYGMTVGSVAEITNSDDAYFFDFTISDYATLISDALIFNANGDTNGDGEANDVTDDNAKVYFVRGEDHKVKVYFWGNNKGGTEKTGLTVKPEDATAAANNYTFELEYEDANTGAELTSFKLGNTSGSISGSKITVALPFGSNLMGQVASFTASEGATVSAAGGELKSGETLLNVTSPVTITVTAEDGSNTNVYTLTVTTADQFSDVNTGDWYYNNVMRAVELGILSGYTDGTFRPMNNITRRDFAIMLAQSLGHDNDEKATSPFKDVADTDYGVSSIAYLYENEITVGDSNGNFNPDANITRQEAAIMLVKAFEATGTSSDLYADDAQIASWAKSFVYTAKAAGLMKGDDHNEFNPTDRLTRAEAASAMVNAVDN